MDVCRLGGVVSLTIKHSRGFLCSLKICRPLLSCGPVMFAQFDRSAHTQQLTENMQYISNDNLKLQIDPSTLKLNQKIEKPVCLMMNYMLAKPKHVQKYADLYLTQGIDVITVSCTPWQLMWPMKGSQVIAERLLRFLEENTSGSPHPLVVHGFSVGAYLWSELLVLTTMDKERYQPVLDRVAIQVWDSGADIHEIPVGLPSAVFPKNKFLQETFRAYIKTHMKIFHNVATKHYMAATGVFHVNPCRAPSLFLVSKTDPIGAEKRSREKAASWENLGIKCTIQCWDRSPHVQHYSRHPEEYKNILYSHLKQCGVIKSKS